MRKYIPKTQEEADYVAAYDPKKYYPNPAVTADCAVYAFDESINSLKLLLIERGGYPYKGDLAIPGGFIEIDESLETAAARELLEETGLEGMDAHLHCVLSEPGRDPRQRVITPEYITLSNFYEIAPKAGDDAAKADWYTVKSFEEKVSVQGNILTTDYSMTLFGARGEILLCAKSTADYSLHQPKRSFEVTYDGELAFDHAEAVIKSFISLRKQLSFGDIACGAIGRRFCRAAYEDLLRAAKLDPEKVNNPKLYEDGEELSFLPTMA